MTTAVREATTDGLFGVFAALARGGVEVGRFYDGLFADLYVAREAGHEDGTDLAFFLELAGQHDGPVLELGCGAGRVVLPLARAGLTVDGVDRSAALLDGLQRRLAGEDPSVGTRVTTFEEDLLAFAPTAGRYGTILVSAVMFPTFLAAGGAPWLRRLVAALAPRGTLCFDGEPPLPAGMGCQLSTRVAEHPDGPVEVTQGFVALGGEGGHVLNGYAEQRRADGSVLAQLASETILAIGPQVDAELADAGLTVAERRTWGGGAAGPPAVACVCVRTTDRD